MKKMPFYVKPIRVYVSLFILMFAVVFSTLAFKLYLDADNIRKNVLEQYDQGATAELNVAFEQALEQINKDADLFSEWDEVYQQLFDPSYYFFWHEDRLKESTYFKPYMLNVELYKANKTLLAPRSANKQPDHALPLFLDLTFPTLVVEENRSAKLLSFKEVLDRNSHEIIGYVGLSIDLLPFVLSENAFRSLDKTSIHFSDVGHYQYQNIMEYVTFKPVSNPVGEYLWELISDFIVELLIVLAFILVFIIFIFQQTVLMPIQRILGHLHLLQRSPNEQHKSPEILIIHREFVELKTGLHDYHTQLYKAQEQLSMQREKALVLAHHDSLTGILNRRAFDADWESLLEQRKMSGFDTAYLLLDCDFFKALNDTYGHEVGDKVIYLTATTIEISLPDGKKVYRIGGDEFAIILRSTELATAFKIANNCLNALKEAPFLNLGIKEQLSFSIGLSFASAGSQIMATDLPRQADIAMFQAKKSFSTKVHRYDYEMEASSKSLVSNELVNAVIHAVDTGKGIQMNYQPIVNLDDNTVYYESLIRLQLNGMVVYPSDIFAVVERRRLDVEIDKQVLKQVTLALNEKQIPIGSGVAVNVSSQTLLLPEFVSLFEPMEPFLKDYKLVIEITETSLVDHMDYAVEVLSKLRLKGFKIALDDFGSGYSSIRYLAHMPVDIVKFDMSLLLALTKEDEKTQNIIKATAKMIRDAGYDLVVEGVETEQMLKSVKAINATHGQGYLLGRPNPEPKLF